MRRKKGMNWKKNIYVYLEIPWLLQVPSFALCLFVFPRFIHLTEQSARWSSQPHRFLSFFNSFHPLRLSPSTRRAPLRLIDFLRPDGVRGYDSNGCSFSHLSPLAPPFDPRLYRNLHHYHLSYHRRQSSRIFFFPLSRAATTTMRTK